MTHKPLALRGAHVLVTGASSGLGLELARQLARDHGAHPVLVARRRERLDAVALELAQFGVTPRVVVADLAVADDVTRVLREATSQPLHAAVLNAGVTYFGHTLDEPWDDVQSLVAINVLATVRLAQGLARSWERNADATGLLLVSSMAGFGPMPYQAVYGASKAFVTSFGASLAEELRTTNVSVTTFCPGGIWTEMMSSSGLDAKYHAKHPLLMPVEPCARVALAALVARRRTAIPGLVNRAGALLLRAVPRSWMARAVARDYAPILPARTDTRDDS